MAKKIALFNHKGGVSKTTTAFNLGWMLAEQGRRVVLVDADPQCNLTGMVLGYRGPGELERFYDEERDRNLMAALAPAFESRPSPVTGVECIEVEGRQGLFLLPGHLRIAEYEVTLGIAQELSGSIQTLQNLPGSISFVLEETAARMDAEYVIVDMSPGLGAINQNLMTTADYFLVPTHPDFFSVMAIDSLARVLTGWKQWAKRAAALQVLRDAAYPFPAPDIRFLGTVIQKFRPRGGEPATAFQQWIDRIHERVTTNLAPALEREGMMLPDDVYERAGVARSYCLATIADFNSLIALSQEHQTPIFALDPSQTGRSGVVLEGTLRNRDTFREVFVDLTNKVIALTDDSSR